MNITQLPDLCLIAIFDKLPLLELLRLKRVCRRFGEMQTAVCLKKTSLQIVDLKMANFWLDTLDFYQISPNAHHLIVKYEATSKLSTPRTPTNGHPRLNKCIIFNSATCTKIIETLPNIRQLTVANYSKSLLIDAHLVEMIRAWSKLTHLSLNGYMNWETIEPYINLLTHLKYFSTWVSIARLSKLSIVSQLTTFNCKYSKIWNTSANDWEEVDLTQTVSNLINNSKVTAFGLQITEKGQLPAFPIPVIQKLTRLSVKLDNLEDLSFIANTWKYLKYLSLQLTNKEAENPLGEILRQLANLEYLTDLSIDIINRFNRSQDFSGNFLANFSPVDSAIPRVLWCRRIKFYFTLDPHKLTQLEVLFPNAESLSFRVLSCDDLSGLLCTEESCQNCGHIGALIQEYSQLLKRGTINSYIIDFSVKFGKIIAHKVRFG